MVAGMASSSRFGEGGAGGGRESPPSLESRVEGWLLAGKPSDSRFERERWWWWARIPSVTRIVSGRVVVDGRPSTSRFEQGRDCGGCAGWWWWVQIPSVTRIASGGIVVGGKIPPPYVSSGGGGGGGCGSCPSLKMRVGGWWLAGGPCGGKSRNRDGVYLCVSK